MAVTILQGLHVFFGILWFGGDMYSNFVVVPTANNIESVHANAFLGVYGKYAKRLMEPAGALAILLGIVVGFKESAWANIGHPYGNTYLASMALAIGIYLWGILLLSRNIEKALSYGVGTPEFVTTIDKVKKYGAVQLLGFAVLFVLMVAMRFGW